MWSNNLGQSLGVGGRKMVIASMRETEMMSGERRKDGNDKLPRRVLAGENGQALVVGAEGSIAGTATRVGWHERTGHPHLGNIDQPLRWDASQDVAQTGRLDATVELRVGLVEVNLHREWSVVA